MPKEAYPHSSTSNIRPVTGGGTRFTSLKGPQEPLLATVNTGEEEDRKKQTKRESNSNMTMRGEKGAS